MQRPARPVYTVAGNICQLVFIWIRDYIAIADDKDAVIAKLHHIRHNDEGTADRIDAIPRPNELQGCPQHFRCRRFHAGYHASRFSGSYQGGAEVQGMVQEETAALFQSHSSGFPFIRIGLRQIFQHPIFFRINHFSPIQIELIP